VSFSALHYDFHIGKSTISGIVRETCQVIWSTLKPTEMPEITKDKWLEIADVFYLKTNFPNCLVAIDGKHIRCKNLKNSGFLFLIIKSIFQLC